MTSTAGIRREVHLLELPVALAARSRQQFEELLRELSLIAALSAEDEAAARDVPARFTELVAVITQQFAGVNDAPTERLDAAIARRDRVIADHVLLLPVEAAPAAQALGDLIDEADQYCRQGQHLLTLATPAECVAYRRWYLSEVIGQLEGQPPTPWPQSPHRSGVG